MRLIFDGHIDLALFALAHNRNQTESVFVNGSIVPQIDTYCPA